MITKSNLKIKGVPIKYIRAPSIDELKQIQISKKLNVIKMLRIFHPIMIKLKDKGEMLLFLDKEGKKVVEDVATAVFNGMEIETGDADEREE